MPNPRHRRYSARLFRRKDSPFWWASYTDASGEPIRQSTGCRNHGEAETWLAARTLERVRAEAGIPQAKPITLIHASAEYLVAKEPPAWSKGWHSTVEGFFRFRVIPHFGEGRVLSSITRPEVEAFRKGELGKPARKGPTKPATVNRLMAALATFGQWCADPDRRYLLSNPFAKHKPHPEDEREVPSLTRAEVDAFLSALPEKRRYRGKVYDVRAIVTLAVETGLRKSELQRLDWKDIRLDEGWLKVVSSWSRGLTKGKKSRPQILTDRAIAVLKALGPKPEGLVFGRFGDFRKSLRKASQSAGLGPLWFHAARHIGASLFAAKGASGHDMRLWGGWSSGRMSDRYTHSDLRRLRAISDARPAHADDNDDG